MGGASTLDDLGASGNRNGLEDGHQGVNGRGGEGGAFHLGMGRAFVLSSLLKVQNGGAGGLDMLIPGTMQVQCKGRERPFWRPSCLANQSRPSANLSTSQPHPTCVRCVVFVFRPVHLEIMHPPIAVLPPPSSSPHLFLPCQASLNMNKCLVLSVSPSFSHVSS